MSDPSLWINRVLCRCGRSFEVGKNSPSGKVNRIFKNGYNVTVYIGGVCGNEKRISFDERDLKSWE